MNTPRALCKALCAVAAAATLSACGGSSAKGASDCYMLTNGTSVCGTQAAAWCRLTDSDRNEAVGTGNLSLAQAEATCADIETKYPTG